MKYYYKETGIGEILENAREQNTAQREISRTQHSTYNGQMETNGTKQNKWNKHDSINAEHFTSYFAFRWHATWSGNFA
jgi:hypothetical protein